MVVSVPEYVHNTVDTNIQRDIIQQDTDIKEETDVLMHFEEEETQVQFQNAENHNSRNLQLEQSNVLLDTNPIEKHNSTSLHIEKTYKQPDGAISIEKNSSKSLQIEQSNDPLDTSSIQLDDEDSLDAIQDIEDKLNCVQGVPAKKPKQIPSTQFEKKFESFTKGIDKQKKFLAKKSYQRLRKTGTHTSTSKNGSDNGNDLSPMEDEEDNQIKNNDSQKCMDYFECHVCGRRMFSSHGSTFIGCSQCRKHVHLMCMSTTFKQKNQNVCLICMFKDDNNSKDSIDIGFGENVNRIE
ncbi:hypothetical protein O0L34_g1707 [Tuta absoluta]|nr:hypothetical protein O0L34_g1707 [Tuta absoluta]